MKIAFQVSVVALMLIFGEGTGSWAQDVTTAAASKVQVDVVNMIPASLSGETGQDSEPFLAVDLSDMNRMVGSAFTVNPNPLETGRAPVYLSEDRGNSWRLHTIIPSHGQTGDITVAGSRRLKRLYSGILKRPGGLFLNILRSDDFVSSDLMDVRASRSDVDQPFVQARQAGAKDRIYVGSNDFTLQPRTAVVDISSDNGDTFKRVGIEARTANPQNGPSVRPAVSPLDDTVYVAFFGWRSFKNNIVTSDVVVVRDDHAGLGQNPFRDLVDKDDKLPGSLVAKAVTIPWSNADTLGFERVGSSLSIAVDPSNSDIVYIAWADRVGGGDIYSIHVRRSTDRGVTWSSDLRVIRDGAPFALAIAENGTVGFLYQQYVTIGPSSRWVTHVEQTRDAFKTTVDTIIADVPGKEPVGDFHPYMGDYNFMLGAGSEFRGVFSTSNVPNRTNFPNGVRYQRRVNFETHELLDEAGNKVNVSIDPFYFSISAVK